jgi:hypothetical protein
VRGKTNSGFEFVRREGRGGGGERVGGEREKERLRNSPTGVKGVARKHELRITRRIWGTVGKCGWGRGRGNGGWEGGQTDTNNIWAGIMCYKVHGIGGLQGFGRGVGGVRGRGGRIGAGREQAWGSSEGHYRSRRGIVEWNTGREAGTLV